MKDYIKRFLIAGIMALCVSLLFLGGKHSQAASLNISEQTAHWIWPADGVITDLYGTRHGHHKGIDIAAENGAPIYAVDRGTVVKSYYSGSYGHVVFVRHPNNFETVYAHLNKRYVQDGQTVSQGDLIGGMGNTGDSSGVHLHFEVHEAEWTAEKKNAVNPVAVLGNIAMGEAVHVFKNDKPGHTAIEAAAKPPYDLDNEAVKSEKEPEHQQEIIHTVQPGETLWSIAEHYKTSINTITTLNGIDGNMMIQPNQKLSIKSSSKNQYIVQPGDTLTSISRAANTTVKQLIEINNLESALIQPQQLLTLRIDE
ncbi:hypothetical protein CVD25_05150 [Bacillus canaveralius]|uniref:LysM domain-containing protein n=1 Tax=Bacillus canaveralius TaxID=1403243 RepID=A0A2N5GRN0_9BACI|nr:MULTISPECIES: M23 family metallopeptidase [Bacillus]PLR84587.1 hypothetical protein CVD23_11815 [Bacillus sp. V33-4]PLR86101.1 hypothetical protein CU635_03440 [Bacillus canaveralius]PLS00221.1 hypothetical protein CVD25_05150 [Bacillus canaveralius]RSK52015.1 LysM peptidoglycan-binding domain-containing protein [Bacillus canaveralius]